MRRLIFGDIHGNLHGLFDALTKAKFNAKEDMLYGVGDYVDGHPHSYGVIDYLSKLPNFKGVIGNHDIWLLNAMNDLQHFDTTIAPGIWVNQGGESTLKSYNMETYKKTMTGHHIKGVFPKSHLKFLKDLELYIELDNQKILIVHAGYQRAPLGHKVKGYGKIGESYSINDNIKDLYWNRNFWEYADNHKNPDYDKVFIGHTQNNSYPKCKKGIIWNIDSGAGYKGYVTVMDIDTLEYYQSEPALTYYKDFMR